MVQSSNKHRLFQGANGYSIIIVLKKDRYKEKNKLRERTKWKRKVRDIERQGKGDKKQREKR